jgi:hypothetical protein
MNDKNGFERVLLNVRRLDGLKWRLFFEHVLQICGQSKERGHCVQWRGVSD